MPPPVATSSMLGCHPHPVEDAIAMLLWRHRHGGGEGVVGSSLGLLLSSTLRSLLAGYGGGQLIRYGKGSGTKLAGGTCGTEKTSGMTRTDAGRAECPRIMVDHTVAGATQRATIVSQRLPGAGRVRGGDAPIARKVVGVILRSVGEDVNDDEGSNTDEADAKWTSIASNWAVNANRWLMINIWESCAYRWNAMKESCNTGASSDVLVAAAATEVTGMGPFAGGTESWGGLSDILGLVRSLIPDCYGQRLGLMLCGC